MSQPELLKRVLDSLGEIGIPYMVTGSVASSLQGEPRSTHDVDLVVALTAPFVPRLLKAFPPPAFYLAESAIKDAMRDRSMFNLLSLDDGEKADFWILGDTPFDRSRFSRRRLEELGDWSMYVSAPEDTILAKLRWSKLCGGSEKQMTDVLRVFEVQGDALDMEYLHHWAKQLGVTDLWQKIQADAEPAGG